MTSLDAFARRALADLRRHLPRFAVIGGLAVSVRTAPRFTRDLDVAVVVAGDREAEELVRVLQGDGYSVLAHLEQEAVHRLAQVRLGPAESGSDGPLLDLLFASSGIEPEIVAAAESLEVLPGLPAPVATTGHLLALKILSHDDRTRPQDRVDIVALLRIAGEPEIEEARRAINLITARGFTRGRDLPRLLEGFLRDPAA